MRRIPLLLIACALALAAFAWPRHLVSRPASGGDFEHFESAHVHPAVLTPSGSRLLVVNTSGGRLAVFEVGGAAIYKSADIPVGLEPVSVACLDDSTAWVVNQVSDDISVVDLRTMNVRATLRVGDEPSDVVFAGTPTRAYVSVTGEDVIRVYSPWNLSAPVAVIPSPGHRPRTLAKTANGQFVYCTMFEGGNRVTVVPAASIPVDSFPHDPDFPRNPGLPASKPRVGLVVQNQSGVWADMYGTAWNSKIKYTMPDIDLAEINTGTFSVSRTFATLGGANFAVAVNPTDGRIAVASTAAETRQLLRLEPRLIGYLAETQIGFVTQGGAISVRKLDPQIDFTTLPGTQAEADSAIAIPTGVTFSGDGQRAYVTSLGTSKIAVLNPLGGLFSTIKARVPVVAGPTGVVVDDARGRIYVVGRFHNQLQTISTANFQQLSINAIGFDPTPDEVVNGRRVFYAGFTSAHGDQSCATCHIFGDTDGLAWDLGDPTGGFVPPPNPNPDGLHGFDPEKGPLVTQTLRGIGSTEPFHWRGDRADIFAFNPAFSTLMGRTTTLPDSQMSAVASFIMALQFPPNPHENLDRTMPDAPPGQGSALRGQAFFNGTVFDSSGHRCVDCHSGPAGTNRKILSSAALGTSQDFKVPQLRNVHRKIGFNDAPGAQNLVGSGFGPDGTIPSLAQLFTADPLHRIVTSAQDRADVIAYVNAFDTGTPPAAGFQITFDGTNSADAQALADLGVLKSQTEGGAIDLVARGRVGTQPRNWKYLGGDQWRPDKAAEPAWTTAQLLAGADLGTEVTVTGVPAGSGTRMGLDQDRDGYFDGDELDAGSDPGSPLTTPQNAGVPGAGAGHAGFQALSPNPFRIATEIRFTLARPGAVDLAVYDVLGREVRSLAHGAVMAAGPQRVAWDGRRGDGGTAGAGVYFVRLKSPDGSWTRSLVRIR